jgi:hypothetical protein
MVILSRPQNSYPRERGRLGSKRPRRSARPGPLPREPRPLRAHVPAARETACATGLCSKPKTRGIGGGMSPASQDSRLASRDWPQWGAETRSIGPDDRSPLADVHLVHAPAPRGRPARLRGSLNQVGLLDQELAHRGLSVTQSDVGSYSGDTPSRTRQPGQARPATPPHGANCPNPELPSHSAWMTPSKGPCPGSMLSTR